MGKSVKFLRFDALLETSSASHQWIYIRVPNELVEKFKFTGNTRRVVCTLNDTESFQCAIMPNGKGKFYITVNKKQRDKLGVTLGMKVRVALEKDGSKYGLPMAEEFREVLNQDPEGDKFFHALTPVKQRTLLHQVNSVEDIDKRIHRGLVILEHLKNNDGEINYEQLFDSFKRPIF